MKNTNLQRCPQCPESLWRKTSSSDQGQFPALCNSVNKPGAEFWNRTRLLPLLPSVLVLLLNKDDVHNSKLYIFFPFLNIQFPVCLNIKFSACLKLFLTFEFPVLVSLAGLIFVQDCLCYWRGSGTKILIFQVFNSSNPYLSCSLRLCNSFNLLRVKHILNLLLEVVITEINKPSTWFISLIFTGVKPSTGYGNTSVHVSAIEKQFN